MYNVTITFNVNGQIISRNEKDATLLSDSIDLIKARFIFSPEWQGYVKTAIFKSNAKKPYSRILVDDACMVPPEAIKKSKYMSVSVFGVLGTQLITATDQIVPLTPSGYTDDSIVSPAPTENVYQQIVTLMQRQAVDAVHAETAQGKAETAQGKAEAAQGKAEAAQTAAESARDAAAQKAEEAETAKNAAVDALVDLDVRVSNNEQQISQLDADVAGEIAASKADIVLLQTDGVTRIEYEDGSLTTYNQYGQPLDSVEVGGGSGTVQEIVAGDGIAVEQDDQARPVISVDPELLDNIGDAVDTANSVETRANNGEFNGKDGADGAPGPPGADGKDGAKGDPGEKGAKGDPGEDGNDGVDGQDGTPATATAGTTTTLSPGSDATVTNVGTTQNAIFNFGIPRGADGAKGDPGRDGADGYTPIKGEDYFDGDKGEQGIQGTPGPKGNDGYTPIKNVDYFDGEKGDKGDAGEQGVQGPKGDVGSQGDKGDKGDKGEIGPQGDRGIQGIQGEQGPKGDDGYTPIKGIDYFDGIQGPKGDKGDKGDAFVYSDFTPIQLENLIGPKGEQGEIGPKGDKGDVGPKGDKGDTGETGPKGDKGDTGLQGIQGPKGDDGYTPVKGVDYFDGIDGEQGIQGIQGIPGIQGERGEQGIQGDKGDKGADGLTTAVKVGATQYDHVSGIISLPAYPSSLPADGGNAATVNGKTVLSDVPLNAKFTDTIVDISGKLNKSNDTLETYTEKIQATTGIINLSLANVFTDTPSASRTYSITNAKSGVAHSFTLIITMGATVRTLTFPPSVKWQGGEIPDMTTASKTYVLTFMSVDGGTTWLGMFGGEF